MPLYDYKCIKCEHEEELIVPADDIDFKPCPKCANFRLSMKRQISAPGLLTGLPTPKFKPKY
jgi:putative FmdB family regulatory protein